VGRAGEWSVRGCGVALAHPFARLQPPAGSFSSGFVVSVADALGAGNTSQLLVPDTRECE
jgi:hypothetical protein